MMTNMDTHDEAAAADFEQGWSAERIAAARRAWGPAVSDGLPVWLNWQLAERAHAGGAVTHAGGAVNWGSSGKPSPATPPKEWK